MHCISSAWQSLWHAVSRGPPSRTMRARGAAGASCGDELLRERAQRAALETQLADVSARLAAAEAELAAVAAAAPGSGAGATTCEYSADRPTPSGTTTCEQFPSGGDLTVSTTAPVAAGAFGVDVRAMTYSTPPAKDNTKHRTIVACSMAVGWASHDCGYNLPCALGRLENISKFWEKAGKRNCDIALLPEDFFGYTTQPVETYIAALSPIAKKYGMYVAAGGHTIPADYNSSVYHQASDPLNKEGYTAILVDRHGKHVGDYHKQFPVGSPGDGWPGRGGTVVFDLDFGRAAMLTCFDMCASPPPLHLASPPSRLVTPLA
eukprot:SAG22_NODE_29_length_28404_cov_23.294153_3_plen_320_part_00